ncbi:MAG: SurA N-terminal domain-containing protein [Coriobacteriia bacterium]|nr:SurA N-terminal domain-containing protein [Coriobacteriia bacterium]
MTDKNKQQPVKQVSQPAQKGTINRNTILMIVAAVVLVALVVGVVLFAASQSKDPSAGAAAKVNNTYVAEADVDAWITQYRVANSLTDDASFLAALDAAGMSVEDFRTSVINQLAENALILERAAELGVSPTDQQIQEQMDAAKSEYAFNDDSIWDSTLATYGLTVDDLQQQYKVNLAKSAVCEIDVPWHDSTLDEILTYMQTYLPQSTQLHAYRILFNGSDKIERAQQCKAELDAAKEAGTLNLDTFIELAKKYSDDPDVQTTGGSYAWSGGSMSDTAKEALQYVDVGEYTDIEGIGDNGDLAILYVDQKYTFPTLEELTAVPTDIPADLLQEVKDSTDASCWETDCTAYEMNLVKEADITIYPMPENASYNVSAK